MSIDLGKVQVLAAKQNALGVKLRFKGKAVCSLGELVDGATTSLTPSVIKTLGEKLLVLERLCFDFNHLRKMDIESVNVPDFIPSTQLVREVKMIRCDQLESPIFLVNYRDAGNTTLKRPAAAFKLVYEPAARAIAVYTCFDLEVEHGSRLAMEVIPDAFIAAVDILRVLSMPADFAYAHYFLHGADYESRYSDDVRPDVQARIDRVFHVLGNLGFVDGHPANIIHRPHGSKMIRLSDLASEFSARYWEWSYEYRFGKDFAGLLDKVEIERRRTIRQRESQSLVEATLRHWSGEDGANEIINQAQPGEEALLSVVLDLGISSEVATKAYTKLILDGNISREAREKLVGLHYHPIPYRPFSTITDKELDKIIYFYLPNSVRFALLESNEYPWELKKSLFFEISDKGFYAELTSPEVLARLRSILGAYNEGQVRELLALAPKKRNADVCKVYLSLLKEALRPKSEVVESV